MKKMRIRKPDYYDSFYCLAGNCPFTCCREWKIAVDEATEEKWKKMPVPDEMGPANLSLSDYITDSDDQRIICHRENGDCPFLDQSRLCRIVRRYGEEGLSHTCHTFPRDVHEFEDRTEYSLAVTCPAVLDLLWQTEQFGVTGQEHDLSESQRQELIRDRMMQIAGQTKWTAEQIIRMLFYLLQEEYLEQGIPEEEELNRLMIALGELENSMDPMDRIMEQNELFLDLSVNYQKQGLYQTFLNPLLRIAYETEELEEETPDSLVEKWETFQKQWKSFSKEMRLLLCEEIYAAALLPEYEKDDMLVKMEWLALEFSLVRYCMFLRWKEKRSLSRNDLKETVLTVFRMTGYHDDDIHQYLEESFAEKIWPMGYLCLIL